jgi:hypothetical protein
MSIEKTISDLTAAVTALTAAINAKSGAVMGAGTATVPQAPAPVAAAPQFTAPAPAAQMPAPPSFAAPAPVVQQASAVPFSDGQGLIAYVMDAYKSMGPTKGAGIQGVLTSIGVANINDVKPEQYATLYAGVEALKRG